MNGQLQQKKTIWVVGRILLRFLILNTIIFAVAYVIAMAKFMIHPIGQFESSFPFKMYVSAFFLSNLIYIIGNLYEYIYLKLWAKPIDLAGNEKMFFKAGIIMVGIVNLTGVIIYFIHYFR
ncbi:MAG: hypothetical protein H0X62_02110 [Bacteroidetes bacterium]|nr:hypothetical protein [Bacteroidota bacterium]